MQTSPTRRWTVDCLVCLDVTLDQADANLTIAHHIRVEVAEETSFMLFSRSKFFLVITCKDVNNIKFHLTWCATKKQR